MDSKCETFNTVINVMGREVITRTNSEHKKQERFEGSVFAGLGEEKDKIYFDESIKISACWDVY